jgi:hypothetical protein
MRKLAALPLYLLLVFGVVAGALPASAAAVSASVPDLNSRVYEAADSFAELPASVNGVVAPMGGPAGTTFQATVEGFNPNEQVGVWWNAPDGTIIRSINEETRQVNLNGMLWSAWSTDGDMPGVWSLVVSGLSGHHTAVVYYEITSPAAATPAPSGIPAPVSAVLSPNTVPAGTVFKTTYSGFSADEPVGYWFNTPENQAVWAVNLGVNWVNDDGTLDNYTGTSGMEPGLWSCVVQGLKSGHVAIVYFVVTSPGEGAAAALNPTPAFPIPVPAGESGNNGRGHGLQTGGRQF